MDQFYYDSGYVDASYFVYTAEAESLEAGSFSMTASVGVIREAAADLTATSEIQATISHIEGADLFAFTEAALAAQVDRIRDNNIEITSAFTQVTAGSKFIHFSSDQNIETSITADNLRVRFSEAAVDAAFSLAADVEVIAGGVVREASADLTSAFAVEVQAQRNRFADSSLEAIADLTAQGDRYAGATAEINSSASQTTVNDRIRIADAGLSAEFTLTASVNEIVQLSADLTAQSSITATISHIEGADLQAFTNASLAVSGLRIKSLESALAGTSTLAATGNLENQRPWQFTNFGSPAYTDTAKVLGTGNLYLATTSDYLRSTSKRPEFSFGTDSFIIEFFTRANSNGTILSYGQYNQTVGTGWEIRRQTSGSNIGFQFFRDNGNTTTTHSGLSGFTSADNWYIRLTRSGTNLSMVVRRLSAGTWSSEVTIFSTTIVTDPIGGSVGEIGGSEYLRIGGGTTSGFVGYIDELYIAKGTTTSQQFISGAPALNTQGKETTTLLLMHLDSSSLDETVGTANATATLTAQASLTAQADNRVKTASANLQVEGFVVSAGGRIRPEVAALDSEFVVTANVSKLQYASASLSSDFALTAIPLDLDLGDIALTAITSLSVTVKKTAGLVQNLSSQSTLVAEPDGVFLTLSADGVNPAGYITSSGAQMGTWQEPPIQANFWIKLDQELAAGQTVIVYQSGTNQIIYGRGGDLPDGVSISSSYYWIVSRSTVHFNPTSGQIRTIYYGARLAAASFDPTEWHNIHMPLRMSKTTGGISAVDSNLENAIWGNVIMVDGQNPSVFGGARLNNLDNLAYTSIGTPAASPREYSRGADGGQWGHASNPVTMYLDQIWVKKNEYTDPINELGIVDINSSEFINADGQTAIHLGLTPGGFQGQVWLPFRSLLDYASTSPTWNYVANNTVTYGLIKTAQANISSQFTQTTAVARVRPSTGTWTSTASLSSSISRTRPGTASLSSTSQLTATAIKVSTGQVTAQVQATLTAPAIKTAQAASALVASADLTAQAVKYRPATSAVVVQATLSTNAVKTASADLSLTVQSALDCQALRIKQIASDFSAIATELAAVVKIGQGFIHADIVATVTAPAVKTTSTGLNATITSQLTAGAISTSQATAELSTSAELTLVPTYLRRNESVMQVTAGQTTNAVKTTSADISLTSQASTSTDSTNSKITGYNASLEATTALTSNNQIVRLATADLTADTQVLATVYSLVQMQAIQVQGFVLTAGKVLHIDEFNQLKIRGETRYQVIRQETRGLVIKGETRVNKIKGYSL